MKVNFGGNYLNADTAKDGDICEITAPGEEVEITVQGKTKKVPNIPVKLNGERELIYSPGAKAGKKLVDAWGDETTEWVGRKFLVKIVTLEIGGKEQSVVRAEPLDDTRGD